jgi:hypothetical protein
VDHWLKGIDTGVMDKPMLRAWMTESVIQKATLRANCKPMHRGK